MKAILFFFTIISLYSENTYAQVDRKETVRSMSRIARSFLPAQPQNKQDVSKDTAIVAQQAAEKITQEIVYSQISSDVDKNIPCIAQQNGNTFAVIIANEIYQRESSVDYALNDGRIFYEYCRKTYGIPQTNIHKIENATLNNIRYELSWLNKLAAAYTDRIKIIVYYAGHGVPDESNQTAYLLPVDGYSGDVSTGISIDALYDALSNLSAENVILFLDACFSGNSRSDKMLTNARGITVTPKKGTPHGNLVVFSATQGDETAYPYKEKGHGLFTYFLLKSLQESNGKITLGELTAKVIDNVRKLSIVVNQKSQTPTVTPSLSQKGKWENITIY